MHGTAPDGRRLHLWHGQDLDEDTSRLAEAIAEATRTELFNVNGSLFWLTEGRLVAVGKDVLREIIRKHVVSLRLVNRGSTNAPLWEVEYFEFDFPIAADARERPNQQVLLNIGTALLALVAKGPREERKLSSQQQREIRQRIGMGEPRDNIARAYNVDIAVIRQLAS